MKIDELKQREKELVERGTHSLGQKRQKAFERFPLVFTMLGAFGLVATLYGFERVIDTIPLLKDNPAILLTTGVAILVLTGSLYKKLQ